MAGAANYAWVNRSTMTFLTRQAFGKVFKSTPDDLDMHVIYDVSHNIAKIEEHVSFVHRLVNVINYALSASTQFDSILTSSTRILSQERSHIQYTIQDSSNWT